MCFFSDVCREERQRFESNILRKLNTIIEAVRGENPGRVPNGNRERGNYTLLPPMPFRDIAALVRFDHDLQENQQLRDEFESLEIKFIQTFIKFQILFKV